MSCCHCACNTQPAGLWCLIPTDTRRMKGGGCMEVSLTAVWSPASVVIGHSDLPAVTTADGGILAGQTVNLHCCSQSWFILSYLSFAYLQEDHTFTLKALLLQFQFLCFIRCHISSPSNSSPGSAACVVG